MIVTRRLVKDYRVNDHRQGRWAALKDLASPRYRTVQALKDVSLRVEPGEMVGIIGPNGAGKSTLVKTLAGVLVPTEGEVEVMGLVPYRHRVRLARRLGVMFGQRTQLWWDLPVMDSLRLHQTMYDIPESRFQESLAVFDDLLDLGQLLNKAVRQLSLGQKTRAELALCLLHGPDLIYLDEPTIGLDVLVKDHIRAFLRDLNQRRGATILLTSHDMGDVEEICRRVIVIDEGTILFDGSLEAVKREYVRDRVVKVTLSRPMDLPRWPDVKVLGSDGLTHTLTFLPEEVSVQEMLNRIVSQLPVEDISLAEPGIGSVIRRLQLREGRY